MWHLRDINNARAESTVHAADPTAWLGREDQLKQPRRNIAQRPDCRQPVGKNGGENLCCVTPRETKNLNEEDKTPPRATGPTTAHPEGAEPETERSSKPLACCPQGRALPPAWWASDSCRAATAKQAPPTHQDESLNLKDKSISASGKKITISVVMMIIDEKIFFFPDKSLQKWDEISISMQKNGQDSPHPGFKSVCYLHAQLQPK